MIKYHKPRITTSTNVIRCLLLNINENKDVEAKEMGVDETTFLCYLQVLIEAKLIKKKKSDGLKTSDYIIIDPVKYEAWSKSDFYKSIEKYVIPFIK